MSIANLNTRVLVWIVVALVVAVIVAPIFLQQDDPAANGPLDTSKLTPEMAQKVEHCHKAGLKSARYVSGGKVWTVVCYEE